MLDEPLRVELLAWGIARAKAAPIRFAVFVDEQRVPVELEMDAMDAKCVHALAMHGQEAIGTGRLLPDGHIGRMAVLKQWRGRRAGSLILDKLMQAARERGDRNVLLSAQVHAVPFYVRHGFSIRGEVYEEAGIPHQDMARQL